MGTHHLAELRVTVSLQQFRGSEVEASKTDSAQAAGSLACSPYLSRLWEGGVPGCNDLRFLPCFLLCVCVFVSHQLHFALRIFSLIKNQLSTNRDIYIFVVIYHFKYVF